MIEPRPPELPGYRFVRPIEGGSGGHAQVYVYQQHSTQREVAVKVLKAQEVGDAEFREILAEAKAMAKLDSHPHIATVIDAQRAVDGRPCLIMTYYSGKNLSQLVSGGTLDVRRVVHLGIQIAGAVQAAHRVNLIHRDIKPANILTDEEGSPRLTDFGIAGRVVPGEDADRQSGLYSLPWCPPEILDSHPGSVASDIYSLGATLWHLLAGRSPVDVPEHNTEEEIKHRIRHVAAPATGRADVPANLQQLLARMLAKRPGDRPPSAARVAAELTEIERSLGGAPGAGTDWYVVGQRLRSPAPTRASADTKLREQPPEAPPEQEPEPPRRSGRLVWAGAIMTVALAGGALMLQPWVDTPRSPSEAGDVTSPEAQCVGCLGDNLPPGVPTVTATRVDAETVQFTWDYSNARESDTYRWRSDDGREDVTDQPALDLPVPQGTRVCVQVRVVRADGSHAAVQWSPEGCEEAA